MRVVVIGAGHAGGAVVAQLRQNGFTGALTLVGEEPVAPYQRPPLSKAWLKGESGEEELMLRPLDFYEDQHIDLRLDTPVSAIDREARTVRTAAGVEIEYDRLILATGARARQAPFEVAADGVLALRSMADAEALKQSLAPGARMIVAGGGYVGLEAAASARALGAQVIVVEREERLLARVACPALSRFFENYHRKHGVDFRLGRSVAALSVDQGRVRGVTLDDGETLVADVVLVGIGAIPNDELAAKAGLPCDNGVVVDLHARTADPAIYAIGDCTCRPLPLYGRQLRLESVPSALEQAKQATASILGLAPPAPETPWFWSDQYDVKLQIAGLPFDVAETIVRGDPDQGRFAIFHLDANQRVQAVEAVNAPPEFMMGRQLITTRRPIDSDRLRNPAVSMKEVAI